jgi:hypothetical protein
MGRTSHKATKVPNIPAGIRNTENPLFFTCCKTHTRTQLVKIRKQPGDRQKIQNWYLFLQITITDTMVW